MKKFSFSLEDSLHDGLRRVAQEHDVSVSQYCREALEERFSQSSEDSWEAFWEGAEVDTPLRLFDSKERELHRLQSPSKQWGRSAGDLLGVVPLDDPQSLSRHRFLHDLRTDTKEGARSPVPQGVKLKLKFKLQKRDLEPLAPQSGTAAPGNAFDAERWLNEVWA